MILFRIGVLLVGTIHARVTRIDSASYKTRVICTTLSDTSIIMVFVYLGA